MYLTQCKATVNCDVLRVNKLTMLADLRYSGSLFHRRRAEKLQAASLLLVGVLSSKR